MPELNPPPHPRHIAIIMDGNGRWAQGRGLPRLEGHRAGAESVRRVVELCGEFKIPYLTLYAFSTENWRRPAAEVAALMRLLERFLREREKDLHRHQLRLHVIGQVERLPAGPRTLLEQVMARTAHHTAGVLTLALSYGGREELARAARRIAERVRAGTLDPEAVTEETVAGELYTAGLPDPDLLIRTSGELRLSNFLLWQLSYAELYVTPCLWPDFGRAEFVLALEEYARRQRRFGGV
ncbi:MAG: isoprenyl transferase [Lentisphaeria bacterium]|jgi:undecaprenyl diphosphate synthase